VNPAPFPSADENAGRLWSRRTLLKSGLLLAALPLVAACAPAAAPAPTAPAKPAEAPKPAAPAAPAASPAAAAAATAAPAAGGRGSQGTLKMLLWQAPTILNPHITQGTKDFVAARLCTEPLISVAAARAMSPVLAAELPTVQNGGLAPDGKSVTYKLKKDVKWADGEPFTADDVVFTYQFLSDPASTAVTAGSYVSVEKVEALDPLTVKITFKEPTGGWFQPFSGSNGQIVPKHALKDYMGANARNAPFNLKSFGTGPYLVEDFKPGDLVIYKANPNYRDPAKPAFARVELKGGGDAAGAARAVFQTAEYDYGWNLQVEAPVLQDIMTGGKGDLITSPGGVEQLYFNQADPNKEVDGERSNPNTKHPFLTDQRVREAMATAVDRATIAKQLYGDGLLGVATANTLSTPSTLASQNTKYEFSLDKANKILDDAGYKRGGDGIRLTPDGVRMKVVLATSINSLRQKEQIIIKDGWGKIGIETELKSVDAGVYFSSAPANPDTYSHFSCDVHMFTSTPDSPFPVTYMDRYYAKDTARSWAQKANNWAGRNFEKYQSAEYNKTFDQVLTEVDLVKAAELWKKLNDIVVNDFIVVPLIDRKAADAKAKSLNGPKGTPFDNLSWNIADWTRS
jgi:peptide/nickel transport system substrate-binding protein